jgi:hypothetical protein
MPLDYTGVSFGDRELNGGCFFVCFPSLPRMFSQVYHSRMYHLWQTNRTLCPVFRARDELVVMLIRMGLVTLGVRKY